MHSYVVNVTLSTSKTFAPSETVSGTNVGLTADRKTTFYIKASKETFCFVAVIVYDAKGKRSGATDLGHCFYICDCGVQCYHLLLIRTLFWDFEHFWDGKKPTI